MADFSSAKSTTLITAALETAGASIQSDMLDYVATADGQSIAGLLYMLSIISALFIFASGGNYRWGRYLIVGPALFLFLTTVRVDSDGTKWSFGERDYSEESVNKALRGVDAPNNGGGTSVSVVYAFWNLFLSEVNSELLKLLNLTDSDSQLNFVQKVEKVMQTNNLSQITDPKLRELIKFTLSAECKEYFHHLRIANNPHSLIADRTDSQGIVNVLKDKVIIHIDKNSLSDVRNPILHEWMEEKKFVNKSYTCQSMWEELIVEVRKNVEDGITKNASAYLSPEQDNDKALSAFNRLWNHYTELYSGRAQVYQNDDARALYAIDWIAARSLYIEIWENNPYAQEAAMGKESHFFQMGQQTFLPGQSAMYNEDVPGAIQQFNVTDKYAQRSEYVNAALSLPYFQGVGLLILSAAYPFFAMLVVMPGRAIGFFTWLGLWAWLKLWDLGFGVVMLIDNMLYAMFPKGPNIEQDDLKNAGIAWSKMLEVDSNFSQAVYYNLISTCLFAVPLVTGMFVKGGGKELVNIINQGWSAHAMRIAGAAASYSRSFQAQGYMGDLQRQIFSDVQRADQEFLTRNLGRIDQLGELSKNIALIESGTKATDIPIAELKSQRETLEIQLKTDHSAALANAAYDSEMKYGQYAANRAVAARYYSHDLVDSRQAAYSTRMERDLAKEYFDITRVGDAATGTAFGAVKAAGSTIVGGGRGN